MSVYVVLLSWIKKKKSQGVHIPATKSKGKAIKRLIETQEFFNASTVNSNQGVGCFCSYDHTSHLFSQKQGSHPAFCVQFVELAQLPEHSRQEYFLGVTLGFSAEKLVPFFSLLLHLPSSE